MRAALAVTSLTVKAGGGQGDDVDQVDDGLLAYWIRECGKPACLADHLVPVADARRHRAVQRT
jgi:hypothetical protein